jgi:hypothetical protein
LPREQNCQDNRRGHDEPPAPGSRRAEESPRSLVLGSQPGLRLGPGGITSQARLVASRSRALDHESDIPDRQDRRCEHRVLIHVFQVEIPKVGVGTHELVELMDLVVG